MPKETVWGDHLPYGEVSSARSRVGVVWSRDAGHVQVFTDLFNDDGVFETGDGVVHKAEDVHALERKFASDGFYVSLDRNGINDLIRYLRRSRDQAFGRDE